ncbi:Hypothetical_protein [Hexamita inflata]|uniref:Hypothetical_protein n=1 Tax=Hexamita inflata TaxID=28002 RepID=A0ABP1KB26_9EUKA
MKLGTANRMKLQQLIEYFISSIDLPPKLFSFQISVNKVVLQFVLFSAFNALNFDQLLNDKFQTQQWQVSFDSKKEIRNHNHLIMIRLTYFFETGYLKLDISFLSLLITYITLQNYLQSKFIEIIFETIYNVYYYYISLQHPFQDVGLTIFGQFAITASFIIFIPSETTPEIVNETIPLLQFSIPTPNTGPAVIQIEEILEFVILTDQLEQQPMKPVLYEVVVLLEDDKFISRTLVSIIYVDELYKYDTIPEVLTQLRQGPEAEIQDYYTLVYQIIVVKL